VEILMEYWPFLVPLIAAQLGLAVAALVHVFKTPHLPLWHEGHVGSCCLVYQFYWATALFFVRAGWMMSERT